MSKFENVQNTLVGSNSCPNSKIKTAELAQVLGNRDVTKEAIFFTETSGDAQVKARFVCALESAARAYPNADIYLLVASLPSNGLNVVLNQALYKLLKHAKNVQVLKVNLDTVFLDSPLQQLYLSGQIADTKDYNAVLSDLISTLIISK